MENGRSGQSGRDDRREQALGKRGQLTPTASEAPAPRTPTAAPSQPRFAKLRPGPGRTPTEVQADQQARLRTAMVDLCAERGYERVTVRAIARLARVSTRTFYKHFSSVEECFADTYDSLMRSTLRRARAAPQPGDDLEDRLRAALRSVLDDIVSHPREARLVLVEAYALGLPFHPRIDAASAGFEQLVLDGLAAAPHEVVIPERIARGIVAGVMRVARTRLLAQEDADLEDVDRQLGDWALSFCAEQSIELASLGRPAVSNGTPRAGETAEEPTAGILGAPGDEEGRILAAVAKLALTGGYSSLRITKIRAEAGVSRRRLDARFADLADCFLTSIETLALSAGIRADRQAAEDAHRHRRFARTVEVLCAEAADHPALTHLTFVEILAPGRKGLQRRERLLSLAASRLRALAPGELSDLAAEASVSAVWTITRAEFEAGRARKLLHLAPWITYLLLASIAEHQASLS
jgi:AcrR family transcriptional regulator